MLFSAEIVEETINTKKATESEFQISTFNLQPTENHFEVLLDNMNGSKYSNGSFNVIRKMNGTANGDHHNGKINGETYGKSNGYSNGSPNGEHNEQTNGLLNGDHHPKTNGELKGSIAKVCNGLTNGESHEKLNGSTNGNGTHPGDLNGHECPTDDDEEEDNFTEEMLDALDEIGSEPASASGSASTGAKPKTATKQEDARQLFLTVHIKKTK